MPSKEDIGALMAKKIAESFPLKIKDKEKNYYEICMEKIKDREMCEVFKGIYGKKNQG